MWPDVGLVKTLLKTFHLKPPAISYKTTLQWKVEAPASKAAGDVSLYVAYDNQQSLKGFNLNSLYSEAYEWP